MRAAVVAWRGPWDTAHWPRARWPQRGQAGRHGAGPRAARHGGRGGGTSCACLHHATPRALARTGGRLGVSLPAHGVWAAGAVWCASAPAMPLSAAARGGWRRLPLTRWPRLGQRVVRRSARRPVNAAPRRTPASGAALRTALGCPPSHWAANPLVDRGLLAAVARASLGRSGTPGSAAIG
jgi:hypothetical protein